MKNKKIVIIVLAVIVVIAIVAVVFGVKKSNKGDSDKATTSSATKETTTYGEQTVEALSETVTDAQGNVVVETTKPDNAITEKSGKTKNDKKNGNVNEMNDIFTDEAIENKETKKKNEQNTTSKTEDETKKSDSKNGDGWSEFY